MNQRERDLLALIRQMTAAELNEAIGLLQAEIRRRESRSLKPTQTWDQRTTRHG